MFDQFDNRPPLGPLVKWTLGVWGVLLLPALILFPLIGMAFDAGDTTEAYYYVWSVWTYPLSFGVAFGFRRKQPVLVWVPAANIVLFVVAMVVEAIHQSANVI